jgi:hypothetical protein
MSGVQFGDILEALNLVREICSVWLDRAQRAGKKFELIEYVRD